MYQIAIVFLCCPQLVPMAQSTEPTADDSQHLQITDHKLCYIGDRDEVIDFGVAPNNHYFIAAIKRANYGRRTNKKLVDIWVNERRFSCDAYLPRSIRFSDDGRHCAVGGHFVSEGGQRYIVDGEKGPAVTYIPTESNEGVFTRSGEPFAYSCVRGDESLLIVGGAVDKRFSDQTIIGPTVLFFGEGKARKLVYVTIDGVWNEEGEPAGWFTSHIDHQKHLRGRGEFAITLICPHQTRPITLVNCRDEMSCYVGQKNVASGFASIDWAWTFANDNYIYSIKEEQGGKSTLYNDRGILAHYEVVYPPLETTHQGQPAIIFSGKKRWRCGLILKR